ncbi:hypothetical protein [Streptomyces sp. WG-D5]
MSEGFQRFALAAVIMLLFWAVSRLWQRMRRGRELSAYEALSRRLGWGHVARAVDGEADRFLGDAPFPGGRATVTVSDYCHGSYRGRRAATFEATFVISTMPDGEAHEVGDPDRCTATYAVWAVQLPQPIGEFTVERAGMLRRAFGAGDDVVRLGHDAFDERFTVRTLQRSAAVGALRGPLAEFLLADPRSKDFPLRFTGGEVISWDRDDQSPERIEPALEFLVEVADLLEVAGPQASGDSSAGATASPTERFIALVQQELASSGAPYRVATAQSRFDIVPDLADARWRDDGVTSVRSWRVTPDAGKQTFTIACVRQRRNADGSLGGVSARGTVGGAALKRAEGAAVDASSADFGVAVVVRAAAQAEWRAGGDWVAPVAIGFAVLGAVGAVAAVVAVALS